MPQKLHLYYRFNYQIAELRLFKIITVLAGVNGSRLGLYTRPYLNPPPLSQLV